MTNTICAEYSTQTAEQQPVGPCVLRPGHRGHIHQDVRGIQWATRPDTGAAFPPYRCSCGLTGELLAVDAAGAHAHARPAEERPGTVTETAELQARLHAAVRTIGRAEDEIAGLRSELRSRDEAMAKQRNNCQRALRDVCAVQRVRDLADRWYGQGAPATSYARELLSTLDNAA
jgi:hypothetical protein